MSWPNGVVQRRAVADDAESGMTSKRDQQSKGSIVFRDELRILTRPIIRRSGFGLWGALPDNSHRCPET
jgi:hypothetical protein